jgi:hypothetical protein
MAHKSRYIGGKKKKNQPSARAASTTARPAELNATPAARVQPPTARPVSVPTIPASVKYANLPRDLRQVAMLAGLILVLLVVAWLILK